MTTQQPTPQIPVWQSVKAAYRNVFSAPGHLSKALAVPLLIAVGLAMTDMLFAGEEDSGLSVSSVVSLILPFVILGLAWGRFALLGEAPGLLPDSRELRRFFVFAGYLLLFGCVFFALIVVTAATLAMSVADYVVLGLVIFAACFVASWPLARLSLVLPATAIDQRLGLGGAWRLSAGNGARLFAALLLIGLPVLLLFAVFMFAVGYLITTEAIPADSSLDRPGTVLAWFVISAIANGLQLLGFALIMAVLGGAYRQLGGWQSDRQELLERFE